LNENTTPATALTSPPLDNWGALHELEAALTRLKVVELYAEEYSTDVRGSVEERNYITKLLQFAIGIYNLIWVTLRLSSDPPTLYDNFLRSLGDDIAFVLDPIVKTTAGEK